LSPRCATCAPTGSTCTNCTDPTPRRRSNFAGWQVADAEWTARTRGYERFVSAQNEYSLLKRGVENDLVPALEQYGIGLLPFFPLASGLLTGKYRRGEPPPQGSRIQLWGRESVLTDAAFDQLEALEAFAKMRSISLLDVAIGGLAAQPAVASVIAGATSREQVVANVAAGAWQPGLDDLAELDELTGT
jgi:aryl-alcohol dehydrogenase-like predicted oxidoreductase